MHFTCCSILGARETDWEETEDSIRCPWLWFCHEETSSSESVSSQMVVCSIKRMFVWFVVEPRAGLSAYCAAGAIQFLVSSFSRFGCVDGCHSIPLSCPEDALEIRSSMDCAMSLFLQCNTYRSINQRYQQLSLLTFGQTLMVLIDAVWGMTSS